MLNSVGEFLSGGVNLLLCMVILPAVCGVLLWLFRKNYILQAVTALVSAAANLIFALGILNYGEFSASIPGAPFGFEYSMRVFDFSTRFIVFTAFVFLLIVLYTVTNLKGVKFSGLYLLYLYLSFAMVNGAMMSDSLGLMLLFWEGLLAPLFGMFLLGNKANPKTAFKAIAVQGLAVLLLMLGIIVTAHMAGTSNISEMEKLPLTGTCLLGFITMMLGALGKAGSMPFHSWTVNAADDAPTVFMTAIPGALEKILGIYFAARIIGDIFEIVPGGGMSIAIMTLGTITIVSGAAMALIQTDMKRLLAYFAVSQTGLMVLGIGIGTINGVFRGIFVLMNYVLFQTGLYMICGIIEKKTGTTDLRQLGGLRKKMPVTAACFIICALSAVGFPGLFGFFTNEILFEAVSESGIIFLVGALLGVFLNAAAFLKMGRSVFFGEQKLPADSREVHETKAVMLIPIGILSFFCVLFGIYVKLPADLLFWGDAEGTPQPYSGWPRLAVLAAVSVAVLLLAIADHMYGMKKTGNALHAAEHIHKVPGLKSIYQSASKGWFDPYNWLMAAVGGFSDICIRIEHGVSWIYDTAVPGLVNKTGKVLHRFDNGSLPRYLSLTVFGVVIIAVIFLVVLL